MRKVCPQCHGTFDGQFLCPNCGVQLWDVPDRSAVITVAAGEEGVRAGAVGRQLLAGLILAHGLYYAMRQTATGLALLGVMPEPHNIFVLMGLQVVTVLAGGLAAGIGNPRGWAAGTAVGVINAILLSGTPFAFGDKLSQIQLFLVWLPNVAMGAFGGFVGRRFWPPVQDLPDPSNSPARKKTKTVRKLSPPVPIAWLRVIAGAALAIGCTVWAGLIRDRMVAFGAGAFVLDSRIQSQFIAWVITTLAMMAGGAFAGAGSLAGVRHGFLVGLLASIGIFIIHQEVVREVLPAEQFFAAVFHLPEDGAPSSIQTGLFLLTNTLLIGVLSGWFGSKLLPKLSEGRAVPLDNGSI
jgi:hypothetical protein